MRILIHLTLCVLLWWVHAYPLSHSVLSDSLWPHGLQPTRLLCPWGSPDKNTGVGCHFLLQGIFPTWRSNLSLLHWQARSFYHWATWWKPQLWSTLGNFLAPIIHPTIVLNGVRCQESNALLPCQSLTIHCLWTCTRLFSICTDSNFPLCCWHETPTQLFAAGTPNLITQAQKTLEQPVSLWALNSGKDPFSPQI